MMSGAVVVVQNEIYNYNLLVDYFSNDEHQDGDSIRIVKYTVEGDPVIITITYENAKYLIENDFRKDRFTSDNTLTHYSYDYKY